MRACKNKETRETNYDDNVTVLYTSRRKEVFIPFEWLYNVSTEGKAAVALSRILSRRSKVKNYDFVVHLFR